MYLLHFSLGVTGQAYINPPEDPCVPDRTKTESGNGDKDSGLEILRLFREFLNR